MTESLLERREEKRVSSSLLFSNLSKRRDSSLEGRLPRDSAALLFSSLLFSSLLFSSLLFSSLLLW